MFKLAEITQIGNIVDKEINGLITVALTQFNVLLVIFTEGFFVVLVDEFKNAAKIERIFDQSVDHSNGFGSESIAVRSSQCNSHCFLVVVYGWNSIPVQEICDCFTVLFVGKVTIAETLRHSLISDGSNFADFGKSVTLLDQVLFVDVEVLHAFIMAHFVCFVKGVDRPERYG
jgi:hypothetical protein